MLIGVPKEIKVHEYRVGLTPESVQELTRRGHCVIVERDAGAGIGVGDADYESAGAAVASTAEEVFAQAELIVKVKEPLATERAWLKPGQAIFTYLHLAADADQARDLVQSGAIAIAYETVTSPSGGLPLLAPMSQVAGLCRDSRESVTALDLFSNPVIFWGIAFELVLILVIVYTPWGNVIFGTAPIGIEVWLFLIPFAAAMLMLEEGRKAAVRRSIARRELAHDRGRRDAYGKPGSLTR